MMQYGTEFLHEDDEDLCYSTLEAIDEQLVNTAGSYLAFAENKWHLVMELPPVYRSLYLIVQYQGEVCNGGLIQFFYNSVGRYAREVVEALAMIGETEQAATLQRAIAAFEQLQPLFEQAWAVDRADPSEEQDGFGALYGMPEMAQLTQYERPFYDHGGELLIEKCGAFLRKQLLSGTPGNAEPKQ